MKLIRLIIADDHPVVRVGLQGMLASQPDFVVVGEATTGREAIKLSEVLHPDIVLMDLRMKDMDGVEATVHIKRYRPDIAILVLTTYDSESEITRALEVGANGYLLKDSPRERLYEAIRAVAQGKPALSPDVMAHFLQRIQKPMEEKLSAREIEVLARVARGSSNKEIGRGLHISEATVKSHLIHIFDKLGVADRTAAVTVALERGLLRLEP